MSAAPSLSRVELYAALDSPADDAAAFLERIAGRAERPIRVLDVGCGTGRLFEPLASLEWEVVGIEPDPEFRAYAERAASSLEGVDVRPGRFQEIDAEGEYDLVIGLNSSFSHVIEPPERHDALLRCRRALRPGGRIVLEVPDLLRVLWEYAGPRELLCETDAGVEVSLLRTHSVDLDRAVFTTHDRYRVLDDGVEVRTETMVHPYAIVSWPELAFHLRQAGFRDPERRRSFEAPEGAVEEGAVDEGAADGAAAYEGARRGRIVAVARRPGRGERPRPA